MADLAVARVLVTGSRDFTDRDGLEEALWRCARHAMYGIYDRVLYVHGDCRTGADAMTRQFAERGKAAGFPLGHEPHPADWDHCAAACPAAPGHRGTRRDGTWYCPDAGPRRNAIMVSLGALKCVYCLQPGAANRGTRNCVSLARRAGIETVPYHQVLRAVPVVP